MLERLLNAVIMKHVKQVGCKISNTVVTVLRIRDIKMIAIREVNTMKDFWDS